MERMIVTVDAQSKEEAIAGLENLLKSIKENYDNYSGPVFEQICITIPCEGPD